VVSSTISHSPDEKFSGSAGRLRSVYRGIRADVKPRSRRTPLRTSCFRSVRRYVSSRALSCVSSWVTGSCWDAVVLTGRQSRAGAGYLRTAALPAGEGPLRPRSRLRRHEGRESEPDTVGAAGVSSAPKSWHHLGRPIHLLIRDASCQGRGTAACSEQTANEATPAPEAQTPDTVADRGPLKHGVDHSRSLTMLRGPTAHRSCTTPSYPLRMGRYVWPVLGGLVATAMLP